MDQDTRNTLDILKRYRVPDGPAELRAAADSRPAPPVPGAGEAPLSIWPLVLVAAAALIGVLWMRESDEAFVAQIKKDMDRVHSAAEEENFDGWGDPTQGVRVRLQGESSIGLLDNTRFKIDLQTSAPPLRLRLDLPVSGQFDQQLWDIHESLIDLEIESPTGRKLQGRLGGWVLPAAGAEPGDQREASVLFRCSDIICRSATPAAFWGCMEFDDEDPESAEGKRTRIMRDPLARAYMEYYSPRLPEPSSMFGEDEQLPWVRFVPDEPGAWTVTAVYAPRFTNPKTPDFRARSQSWTFNVIGFVGAWSEEVDGLRARLLSPRETYEQEEFIPLVMQIENRDGIARTYNVVGTGSALVPDLPSPYHFFLRRAGEPQWRSAENASVFVSHVESFAGHAPGDFRDVVFRLDDFSVDGDSLAAEPGSLTLESQFYFKPSVWDSNDASIWMGRLTPGPLTLKIRPASNK